MATRRVTPLSRVVDQKLYIAGMTRTDLAESLGISYNYLCIVLSGRNKPTIEMTDRMAAVLEMEGRDIRELALRKAM